ncbi:MAG TPA: L-lactate permease [Roseiarcus sp.]|nr:L-lactate permease [Roseiarcus sp.]
MDRPLGRGSVNTLTMTGVFETFRRWLIAQGTLDVRVQTLLFAWAFGALLEGLVGFGYPWAFVAPILITLGLSDLDAIRVAAIANNAPVSYGALGAPIIAIAQVTGYPLLAMSASVGSMVAILALLPPWVLIYLVSGREGLKDGWPLAIVGSLGYIPGQYPVAVYLEPYLPDVSGAIVCFAALLLLLSVWKPKRVLALRRRSLERRGAGQGAPGGGPRSRRATHRLSAFRRADHRRHALERPMVAAAEDHPGFRKSRGERARDQDDDRRGVQLRALRRRLGDCGFVDHRRGPSRRSRQAAVKPTGRDLRQDLQPDLGRVPGWNFHLRPCLSVQLFGHGLLAG